MARRFSDGDDGVASVSNAPSPVFVTGPLLRHILVMTGTSAVGLMAIFAGDLANMLFLSSLGDESILAAVGYASSILFFMVAIGIGLSIAATALVAPALGAGLRVRARRISTNVHVFTALVAAVLAVVIWLFAPQLLSLMGARGRAHELATTYLNIQLPFLPALAMGMTSSAVLRSVGDARRAMHVTLTGAIVNTLLDIVLILGLGYGIAGAAVASGLARLVIMGVGIYGVVGVHDLMSRFRLRSFAVNAPVITAIAVPAMLTNIATPVSNAYVTAAVSPFGDSAVAGWAIIGRIMPVAFGAVYALSGSVGPVLGQNFGAGLPARMRDTLTLSLMIAAAFTGFAWIVLALCAWPLVSIFAVSGDAANLIVLFCRWLAPLFVFLGALFVANAVLNTLGYAHYSTALNWGRATLGTIPFVWVGQHFWGAEGAVAGNMAGGILFGLIAVGVSYRAVDVRAQGIMVRM